jgi:hypothetical protein
MPLIEACRTGSPAEAQWAFETLKTLPDEALEKLLLLARSTDSSRTRFVTSLQGALGGSELTMGQVVRFLFCERMGRWDGDRWSESTPSQLEQIEVAWSEFRRKSS